jgi:hypothetical protein
VVGHERALQNVIKIRDQFVEKDNERSGIFTEELEINDYPQMVRARVQSRDFLTSIGEITNCKIQVKGTFFEVGARPPSGHRRLYLYVESVSKHEAASAIKEIKRTIEDLILTNTRSGGRPGAGYSEFSGSFGKF